MSKDYRCKDCMYWKEYGMWCTYTYKHAGDLLAGTPADMPDKIYFDGVDTSLTTRLAINEEYIRKDKVKQIIRGSVGPQEALRKIDSL